MQSAVVSIPLSLIPQGASKRGMFLVVCDDHAAFHSGHDLGRKERKGGAPIAEPASLGAAELAAMRVGCILDEEEPVSPTIFGDLGKIGRDDAADMDPDYAF